MRKKETLYIFFVSAAFFANTGCGGFSPQNQVVNLPPKQNSNTNIVSKKSSAETPSPVAENIDNTNAFSQNEFPNNSLNITNSPVVEPENEKETEIVVVEKLTIPVAGVRPEDLRDTFKDARSEGRVHDAIDIMAPSGTPVLAAADGEIARFFDSERGGITIYQFSADRKLIYYYAHLKQRAENLQEHVFVKQGSVIGYVGDTGNAGPGNNHLHFAVWRVTDPKRYWDGENINPYPLLR